ncbi:MAG: DUF885 domain-containing protein [SAR202 cluster bacterium]|nr:DUF885 domain-containing protein [SAR202 cluster bacterium]
MDTQAKYFDRALDHFLRFFYAHHPVDATFIGVHDYDGNLPDFSPGGVHSLLYALARRGRELRAISPASLTHTQALDKKLVEGFIATRTWEYSSGFLINHCPAVYSGEAALGLIALLRRPFAPIQQRAESLIQRLEAIPAFLQQAQANLQDAPPSWTDRAIKECVGARILIDKGIPILAKQEGFASSTLNSALTKGSAAFAKFQHFLESDLRQRPSDAYSCGPEALDIIIKKCHFLKESAAEIEAYALEQFHTSRALLEAGALKMGVRDYPTALALLDDHQASASGFYASHQRHHDAVRAAAIEHHLFAWPEDYDIQFVQQPPWLREAAPYLYVLPYHSEPAFDHLPFVDYMMRPMPDDPSAHKPFLRANNDSVVKLNYVVHHGGLGHHIQNYYAYRAKSRIGQIAAVDVAYRIAMLSGGTLCEGWAQYTVDLMEEIGLMTPLEKYSQHYARMRAAARAIVDVKLHTGQWSFETCEAFYKEHVNFTPAAARTETVRDAIIPGVGMMYLLGIDGIKNLRRDMQRKEGASFNLQSFHDRLLAYGSIPVPLIAEAMLGD